MAVIAAGVFLCTAGSIAAAGQLVLDSTGGTATLGSDFSLMDAAVTNPHGTLSLDCPITFVGNGTYAITYDCSGGSLSFQSNDGTTSVSASFGTAALVLTASGGGRGGNISYYYSFSGDFSGIETLNGAAGVINGRSIESIGPLTAQIGSACCGNAGITSAYTPIYITDYSFSQLVAGEEGSSYAPLT